VAIGKIYVASHSVRDRRDRASQICQYAEGVAAGAHQLHAFADTMTVPVNIKRTIETEIGEWLASPA
jgi:hypothetical protein